MNLASKSVIKNLLSAYGVRPSKGLGQNFLADNNVIGKVIEAADIRPNETILEIGPGPGVLTQELAKKAKRVIAVEKDPEMVKILGQTLKNLSNVEVINRDIRKIENWKIENYKVVGNLPFYLTAPVIRKFLENAGAQPMQMVLVVQKEVAQRICAKIPDMNLLAVSVQFYAKPKIISYVSKESFWPSPEVDAAILRITPIAADKKITADLFFKIAKAGFSQPRKQLINNLSKRLNTDKKRTGEWLLENNIQPTQRAETLTIENWEDLTKSLKTW